MQSDSLKNLEKPKEMLFEFQQEAKLNLDDKAPLGMAQFSGDKKEDKLITEEVTEGKYQFSSMKMQVILNVSCS